MSRDQPRSGRVRVAAAQFEVGEDVAANLATSLRMIDEAAAHRAQIIVLPEFCQHLSWYENRTTAHRKACRLGDPFLSAIAAKAAEHAAYIKINVTVARDDGRTTGTNLLYDPAGRLVAQSDKLVLMGAEGDHLDPGTTAGPIVPTPYGRLAMYACMEGVINEVCRDLAVRGAQVLLNGLNSFATDEASLHIPVRAAENRVWVVAANKVGPLLPAEHLPAISERLGVPPEWVHGAGESQIVAPDGTVLAKAPRTGEAVVVADIEPERADDKRRPDGTDLFAARRPARYRPIVAPPHPRTSPPGAAKLAAAVICPAATTTPGAATVPGGAPAETAATVALVREVAHGGAKLIVLPELAFGPEPDLDRVAALLADAVKGTTATVVTSVRETAPRPPNPADLEVSGAKTRSETPLTSRSAEVEAGGVPGVRHTGVAVGAAGALWRQPQLHGSARHSSWVTEFGSGLAVFDLPWGRLAIVVGDDALFPETFRLAAIAEADVVAVPFTPYERWETETGLLERAAENRLNVVAAGPDQGLILSLTPDFTLWTAWAGPFTGRISHPLVTRAGAEGPVTTAVVQPAQAVNRRISKNTDLVEGRPWQAISALAAPAAPEDSPETAP